MAQLAIASFVFLVLHVLPSTGARQWLIRRIGDPAYMGLFSLVSVLGLAWMIYAYGQAPASEPLWTSGPIIRWLTALVMLFAFILVVTGSGSKNPTSVMGKAVLKTRGKWTNIFAVTRHPVMWATAIWAGLHLLNRPDAASALLFGTLGLLAIAGPLLQERRKREEFGKAWDDFAAQTSFVPFAGLISGKSKLHLRDIGGWPLASAVAIWLAALFLHQPVIGVSPLPL